MSGSDEADDSWSVGKIAQRAWNGIRDPLDEKRGILAGGITGAIDDYKQISGAKAAEDATKLARQQFEEQKIAAEKGRLEAQAQQTRDQISQSQRAGSARSRTANSSTNKGTAIGGSSLADGEKDFLGL